jgi:hypothetical protein
VAADNDRYRGKNARVAEFVSPAGDFYLSNLAAVSLSVDKPAKSMWLSFFIRLL